VIEAARTAQLGLQQPSGRSSGVLADGIVSCTVGSSAVTGAISSSRVSSEVAAAELFALLMLQCWEGGAIMQQLTDALQLAWHTADDDNTNHICCSAHVLTLNSAAAAAAAWFPVSQSGLINQFPFDPAGMYSKDMAVKEVKNGRLAMVRG
jgi:hypothetical protein